MSKRFAVSFCSLFDNIVHISFVEAENKLEAAKKVVTEKWKKSEGVEEGAVFTWESKTYEQFCEEVFNGDELVGAEEVPNV